MNGGCCSDGVPQYTYEYEEYVGPREGEVWEDALYKVLVVGDVGTGKTAWIQRLVKDTFSSGAPKPTIGVDFSLKTYKWGDTATTTTSSTSSEPKKKQPDE